MNNSKKKSEKLKVFQDLAWNDLESWTGGVILGRGQSYQRRKLVENLSFSVNGSLIAWVNGSRKYATQVSLNRGRLHSECTCPYDGTCKHAVAVVLEYLSQIERAFIVPTAAGDDKRLSLLKEYSSGEDVSDDALEYEGEPGDDDLDNYLDRQDKNKLKEMVKSAYRGNHAAIVRNVKSGLFRDLPVDKLEKMLRRNILKTSAQEAWADPWHNEFHIPDYAPIRQGLESLLSKGRADVVVKLGELLLREGAEQVGQSNDEGDTAGQVASCFEVVYRALPKTSMSRKEQMMWAIRAEFADEYGLCDDSEGFWKQRFISNEWSYVADQLISMLQRYSPAPKQTGFMRDYKRSRIADRLVDVLEKAGRKEEIIPLCIREAEAVGEYRRLVDRLMKAKRWAEAEEWIKRGIRAVEDKETGTSGDLRDCFRRIKEIKREWPMVAALRAQDFIGRPSIECYRRLQQAAIEIGVWPVVRERTLTYLEKGLSFKKETEPTWPLPEPELSQPKVTWREAIPNVVMLIQIFIYEKKPEETLRWYDCGVKNLDHSYLKRDVAEAVQHTHPDRAIRLWLEIAEELIANTNPRAYQDAMPYLTKAKRGMESTGKETAWSAYCAGLREKNKRKIRFIELLNIMGGGKIFKKG